MPWAAAAAVGGQVVGGVMGDRAARRGADAQQRASDAALAEQRRQFDLTQERQLPFHEGGVEAVNRLRNLQFQAPTAESVASDPGYAFGLNQGRDALESSAAARGSLYSGNTMKKLLEYGTDYAGTKFNDAFERSRSTFNTNAGTLTNLANLGTGAAAQLQNAGANFANNTGSLLTSNANAQAASGIARANNFGNILNQGISTAGRNNWWGGSGGGGGGNVPMSPGTVSDNGGYAGWGEGYGFAGGGPVMLEIDADGRYVPKVGSRTPRPSSGGGQLSNDNVLRAMVAAQQPPPASSMSSLPANPLTSPAAILAERERRAGIGYADGGPVMVNEGGRMVPKVGTRSARPSAGGGAMSRDAVLAALSAAQAGSAPAAVAPAAPVAPASSVGALPANPLTSPRAIQAERERQAGLYNQGGTVCAPGRKDYGHGGGVHGPGGPRDDAIPARLSNGEHVFDAESVTAFGDGDNARGQQKLNRLRAILKAV